MRTRLGCILVLLLGCQCISAQSETNLNNGENSLRSANLPAHVRRDIVAAIAKDFADEPKEFPSGSKIALGSWVGFVRLSQTGAPAILVTSGPDDPNNGATGNGEFWLFKRAGDHAVLILKGGGFDASPAKGAYHNGLLDFKSSWNMSCCDGGVEVYRFNGVRYKPSYCYSYSSDEDGKVTEGPRGRCRD